ncbi:MAG: SGNH/GDSL hydrolase family protein [Pseudomonadota bacterium]
MKNTLKILLVWLVITLFPMQTYASDKPADDTIKQLIFFGDSLSDPGNLYTLMFGALPKSPPYFKGRFSNGPVWTDVVASYFDAKNISSRNYALGGESVLYHEAVNGKLPFMLEHSLKDYLDFYVYDVFSPHPDLSHTLYVIFIGANDYIWGSEDPEKDTTNVNAGIKDNLNKLIAAGGKHFIMLNLPDLSSAPASRLGGDLKTLKQLTMLHNTKLAATIEELLKANPGVTIKIFDYYTLSSDIFLHPEIYNKKYNLHITNTLDACYTGGYQLLEDKNQEAKIAATLEQLYKTDRIGLLHKQSAPEKINFAELAHAIATNPELSTAYAVGQNALSGVQPCADPSSYLFWDYLHPTAEGHAVTGAMVIDYIEKNFTL